MAVALEHHHFVDLFSAELDHTTNIVASKIDEHHVLGDFFGVLTKFRAKSAIFFFGCASTTSSGDRTRDHTIINEFHHWLWRRARKTQFRHPNEIHIRAGIHLTKYAVEIERVSTKFKRKSLRQDNLKNVAIENAFFGDLDRTLPLAVGHRPGDIRKIG